MENMGGWEQKNLINELMQGRELAKQLHAHLNMPSSSVETREFLVQKILSSYEKSLSMLNYGSSSGTGEPHNTVPTTTGTSGSPHSLSASPRSEDSDRENFKDQQDPKDASRKRKAMPRWTQQVRITPGSGLEGPLDDGFSWRKYGQKDIFGAKYPRGYYRCTHRNVQGCSATKQVQRTDEDPGIFEITYRGRHTCNQGSNMIYPPLVPPASQEPVNNHPSREPNTQQQANRQTDQPTSQELLLNLRKDLRVRTQELDRMIEPPFPPFVPFPLSSHVNPENQSLSSSMVDNNSFIRGFPTPNFVSPATSGTNYLSVSSIQGNISFPKSETKSEITEIISAATSATNSPTVDLDFPFGNMDFDPNFTFDNPGFFS